MWGKLKVRDYWSGDVGKPASKGLLENLGVDERIILKDMLKKLDVNWIVLAQDRQMAGSGECGNEPSNSIK
jgi:hypothetical protein